MSVAKFIPLLLIFYVYAAQCCRKSNKLCNILIPMRILQEERCFFSTDFDW